MSPGHRDGEFHSNVKRALSWIMTVNTPEINCSVATVANSCSWRCLVCWGGDGTGTALSQNPSLQIHSSFSPPFITVIVDLFCQLNEIHQWMWVMIHIVGHCHPHLKFNWKRKGKNDPKGDPQEHILSRFPSANGSATHVVGVEVKQHCQKHFNVFAIKIGSARVINNK